MQFIGLAIAAAVIAPLAYSQEPATGPQIEPRPPVLPLVPIAPAPPIMRQPAIGMAAWQPLQRNGSRMPSLNDLVLAKVDLGEGGAQVIMMIQSYRTRKSSVTVTKIVHETREREIEVDGETKKQPYTVKVPVTEQQEVEHQVPAGPKPFKIAGNETRFFNLDAEEISIDQAGKILTSLRPVFLIDQNGSQPLPLPDICQRAMNEDCLIAVTEKKVRQLRQPGPMFFVPPQAPPPLPVVPVLPAQP